MAEKWLKMDDFGPSETNFWGARFMGGKHLQVAREKVEFWGQNDPPPYSKKMEIDAEVNGVV